MYKKVQDSKLRNSSNMYNMKDRIIKEDDRLEKFQKERIDAFDAIEDQLKSLIKRYDLLCHLNKEPCQNFFPQN